MPYTQLEELMSELDQKYTEEEIIRKVRETDNDITGPWIAEIAKKHSDKGWSLLSEKRTEMEKAIEEKDTQTVKTLLGEVADSIKQLELNESTIADARALVLVIKGLQLRNQDNDKKDSKLKAMGMRAMTGFKSRQDGFKPIADAANELQARLDQPSDEEKKDANFVFWTSKDFESADIDSLNAYRQKLQELFEKESEKLEQKEAEIEEITILRASLLAEQERQQEDLKQQYRVVTALKGLVGAQQPAQGNDASLKDLNNKRDRLSRECDASEELLARMESHAKIIEEKKIMLQLQQELQSLVKYLLSKFSAHPNLKKDRLQQVETLLKTDLDLDDLKQCMEVVVKISLQRLEHAKLFKSSYSRLGQKLEKQMNKPECKNLKRCFFNSKLVGYRDLRALVVDSKDKNHFGSSHWEQNFVEIDEKLKNLKLKKGISTAPKFIY